MLTPDEIRTITIKSLFSDDKISEIITLKGGNALSLLDISDRASVDIDFSIRENIRLSKEVEGVLFFEVLERGFLEYEYHVIDYNFSERPEKRRRTLPPFWGGYKIEFKLLDKSKREKILRENTDLKKIEQKESVSSEVIDPTKNGKKIEIDLSFDEYTRDSKQIDVEGVSVYIYSPVMIIYEKMRALCQQMPEYELRSSGVRARDLHDIYMTIFNPKDEDMSRDFLLESENLEILKGIFSAKEVPLKLLNNMEQEKEKLNDDYKLNVMQQINKKDAVDFDYLFEYVQFLMEDIYEKISRQDTGLS